MACNSCNRAKHVGQAAHVACENDGARLTRWLNHSENDCIRELDFLHFPLSHLFFFFFFWAVGGGSGGGSSSISRGWRRRCMN